MYLKKMIDFFYQEYSKKLIVTFLLIDFIVSIVKLLIKLKKSKTMNLEATKQKRSCFTKKIKK